MMKELYFLSVVQIMQSISTELAAQFQPHYDYLGRGLIVCLYQVYLDHYIQNNIPDDDVRGA